MLCPEMNINSNLDPSNLNTNGIIPSHHDGFVIGDMQQQQRTSSTSSGNSDQPNMFSNLEYLKNLADAMANQGGQDGSNNQNSPQTGAGNHGYSGGNNFQGSSSNNASFSMAGGGGENSNDFLHMQHNNGGSDTDTCASSLRRVSRGSLVSRDSLSDMLNPDQVASNNLAMMNMLANQQQQQMGGNQNSNMNFANFNNNGNNQSQQHNQALNQSMSQLMMNGSMGMNSMGGQLNASAVAASMMNNSVGGTGWNSNNNSNNTSLNMNDPSLLGAYGLDGGGVSGKTQPLLIPPKKTKNKHKQTFAQKLMHILSIKECQGVIRWMPNGCAFCIIDCKELVEKVLPKYFKEAKYTSFTRKLNRWGFKHFTLPTSEPSQEKEMSIYTHEKFLRDNPAMCQQMDGGHRRRNSQKESQDETTDALGTAGSQGSANQGSSLPEQLQQQNMMLQQMQQMQQESMMLQQLQAQQQQMNQNQGNQASMFDMSASNNMQGGGAGGTNFNSMMEAFNNNSNGGLMGNQGGNNMNMGEAALGMRRTSLGFMPYLPASNRRDSGFSTGGISTVSNNISNSFTAGTNRSDSGFNVSGNISSSFTAGLGGNTGSSLSLEKFRKMSPTPTSMGNNSNATFDNILKASLGGNLGDGKTAEQNKTDQDISHSQAKLAVLEDMIANEQRKQSMLSSLDPDPVTM